MQLNHVKEKLRTIPRIDLAFLPTPLYKLNNLSKMYGVNIYIKRDDLTGKNIFGGNKTRKLEYLIAEAIQLNCDYVLTYGSTQSNHAMQTSWAARSYGLSPILYLTAYVQPDAENIRSNLLLDQIYDSEIHIVYKKENESFSQAEKRSHVLGKERIEQLKQEKKKTYEIPMGGANLIGAYGYLNAMIEIYEQLSEMGINIDYLYHATGSGGTLAGLMAGKKLLHMDVEIHSISAMKLVDRFEEKITHLTNDVLRYFSCDNSPKSGDFFIDYKSYLPRYEIPTKESTKAITLVAQNEGLLLDPVYTSKAFLEMIKDIKGNKIPQGSNVLFLHTGGITGLFAEKEMVGCFNNTQEVSSL